MVLYLWLVPVLVWLFLVGAAIGSFLNVCIYRLAAGKSLIWPGSRCGHCFHEVRLKDNIPLASFWLLRGRCRDCGIPFSSRYFWIELLTALAFVTVYLLEIALNVQRLRVWSSGGFSPFELARFPPHSWEFFLFHAALACFLIVATTCLLDTGRVPASVAVAGTVVGLAGAMFFPWPYPETLPSVSSASYLPSGFYPWPIWVPLPDHLVAGTCPLGLLTGLAGAVLGAGSLRLLSQLTGAAAGRPIMPAAAADLALIAGAFLGWQPILIGLLLTLAIALPLYVLFRRPALAGPVLTLSLTVCWLAWGWLGPRLQPVLFDPLRLAILGSGIVLVVTVEGVLLRAAEA